jgi:hypothetical protein
MTLQQTWTVTTAELLTNENEGTDESQYLDCQASFVDDSGNQIYSATTWVRLWYLHGIDERNTNNSAPLTTDA